MSSKILQSYLLKRCVFGPSKEHEPKKEMFGGPKHRSSQDIWKTRVMTFHDDDIPFSRGHVFSGSMLIFRGVFEGSIFRCVLRVSD